MTESLQRAFDAASQLPEIEQDAIATWLLTEMKSDTKWSELFGKSQGLLSKMASDALDDHRRGETRDVDMN